ncbi:hypothetical protein D3C81_1294770 [compost metagenome]
MLENEKETILLGLSIKSTKRATRELSNGRKSMAVLLVKTIQPCMSVTGILILLQDINMVSGLTIHLII